MQNFESQEVTLAHEIAETLNDRNSVASFVLFARKYKESYLREKLAEVMSMDEAKITKSRGAYFTWLIKRDETSGSSRS